MTGNGRTAATTTAPFPLVVLIGPPGAGKTTVGTLLASRLRVGFTDTDAVVEAAAGKPVSDIFVSDGEPEFRRLERDAVAAALALHDSTADAGPDRGSNDDDPGPDDLGPDDPSREDIVGVLGLGGGAVLDERTQAALAGRAVVYLETGFTELAKRVGLDRPRPLLIGTNPRAQLKSLLDARLPVYGRLAWLTVTTDGRDPDDVAAEIADKLIAAVERGEPPGSRQ